MFKVRYVGFNVLLVQEKIIYKMKNMHQLI